MLRKLMQKNTEKRGFTLFIAVITASIILAIGVSILNITLKEFILSSLTRNSDMAFNAADAGIECAVYWDTRATTSFTGVSGSVECMGQTVSFERSGTSPNYTYTLNNNDDFIEWGTPAVCAVVTVQRTTCNGFSCTKVESRGYNKDCGALSDVRTLERALRTTY